MIIGIDASRANRRHKTGTEWYAYYIIRWLAKIDSQNQYILYADKPLSGGLSDLTTYQHYPGDSDSQSPEFDKRGYQVIKSPYGNFKAKILKWPFNFLWTQGRLSIEMLSKPVDLLFVPAHTLPIIHPKKSVVTIHDVGYKDEAVLYEDENIGPKNKFYGKVINLMAKLFTFGKFGATTIDYHAWSTEYALKHASKIITVSNFSKDKLAEFNLNNPSKIAVVHNGYNKYLYKRINNPESINQILDIYGIDMPYIFYVGRIEKKKNIPRLIEAFALFKEDNPGSQHKLILAGNASFGYDETTYLIREYCLNDEVFMPGWIEERDLPHIYNAAELFIFPSNYEGFGIPLLQAMACGVPIAASNCSSIPEVAGDAAIYFDPSDPISICESINKILTDKSLSSKLIENGLERIKKFSWETTARQTLQELNDV